LVPIHGEGECEWCIHVNMCKYMWLIHLVVMTELLSLCELIIGEYIFTHWSWLWIITFL